MKNSFFAMGLLGSLALGSATAPASADGEEEAASSGFSGYVTLTSDYRFRGISQSDNDAAVQAAVNYTHESGFFLEAWASNIDFSPFGDSESSVEVDLTAGYNCSLSDLTALYAKAVYYWYVDADILPGDPDYNYWEFMVGIERKLFSATTLSLEVAYSPDTFAEGGEAWAVTGGLAFPIADKLWFLEGVEASGHFGSQSFNETGLVDYVFWDLGLSTTYDAFSFDVRYVDTDLNVIDCGPDICEEGVVFSATVGWGG